MSEKIYHKACKKCGSKFTTKRKTKRLCPACGDCPEDVAYRAKKRKPQKESPLDKLLREINEYNREHGTNLSYGQYVSKFGR